MAAKATSADPSSAKDGVDPRNQLNELTGKEWIQETSTVWRQKGLGADHPDTHFERLHPAPFSFQDIARLIRFFTKPGMLVLDPFAGVASSLKAAALEGRRGIGVELSPKWAELGRERLAAEVPDDSQQDVWCMDVREALPRLEA
jgi:DNA modification methylase